MLRMLFHDALCPQPRATLWVQYQRELRRLTCARHFQALAASWLPAIFQSACERSHVLPRACATAERLAAKASRKRRTTAHILPDTIRPSLESSAVAAVVNASLHAYATPGGPKVFGRPGDGRGWEPSNVLVMSLER